MTENTIYDDNEENSQIDKIDNKSRYVETTALGNELTNKTMNASRAVVEIPDDELIASANFESFVVDVSNITLTPLENCFMAVIYTMFKTGKTEFSINQFAAELARRKIRFNKVNELNGVAAVRQIFREDAQQQIDVLDSSLSKNQFSMDSKEIAERNIQLNYDTILQVCGSFAAIDPNTLDKYSLIAYELLKMSLIHVRLNLGKYDIRDKNKRYRELLTVGQLLPLRLLVKEDVKTGDLKIYFKIDSVPILYEYAEKTGRIAKIPNKILDIPEAVTLDDMTLTQYITKRIMQMKNRNNNSMSRLISYEYETCEYNEETGRTEMVRKGLLASLGIYREQYSSDRSWSNKKMKVHKQVGIILQKCVDEHQIKGFEVNKRGNKTIGYRIIL